MIRSLLAILMILLCAPASAAELQTSGLARLPIEHEGRVKPLGSFAQGTLKTLSGADHLENMSAEQWLALSLFDPAQAVRLEVFAVNDKTLRAQLGLDEKQKLFSYAQLGEPLSRTMPQVLDILQTDPARQTAQQKNLIALHEHAALYGKILRSFSGLLPLDIDSPKERGKSFMELEKTAKSYEESLQKIIREKGMDPDKYTAEEMRIAKAAFSLNQIREGGQNNEILRVIPGSENTWLSPWQILQDKRVKAQQKDILKFWGDLAEAYREEDGLSWRSALATVAGSTREAAGESLNQTRLNAEILYRTLHPYYWIMALYALSIAAAAGLRKRASKLTAILALAGILLHITALGTRIYILDRPPVGTLYESVLFVSLICAGLGAWLGIARKSGVPLIMGALSAMGLLAMAPIAQPGGDSLEVLVAVLNTNFWLATHVLCITAGYGTCILCAGLAHAQLAMKDPPARLQQNLYQVSLIALALMVIGTVLGGIWADQSWGRFWGWDPKENGALLICLWLIWVQHGRISHKLGSNAFTAMLAALNIIVALSWFGVNLLSVGLHSYGFTSGMATGLALFCGAELALIAALWYKKART